MRRAESLLILVLAAPWSQGCAGVTPTPEQVAARIGLPDSATEPADAEAREAAARERLLAGDFDGAVELAEDLLAEAPRRARARAVLAVAMLERAFADGPVPKRIETEAEGQALAAERLLPKDPVTALLRARVLARIGHLSAAADAAEASLARAFATDAPDYVELLAAAALYCHELGEDRRARKLFVELATRRPRDPDVRYRLGTCLLRNATTADEGTQAVREFRAAIELAPADFEARHALVAALTRAAELFAEEGKGVEAAAQTSAAAEFAAATARLDAQSARAAFDAGVTHEVLGDLRLARDFYDEALRRDPEHVPSLLNRIALADRLRTEPPAGEAESWQDPRPMIDRVLAIDDRDGGLLPGERQRLEALQAGRAK